MGQRALSGAPGFSSGTEPLPWPTNTPWPTMTDDLLPMMTLGCGEVRLERVPSAQTLAFPGIVKYRCCEIVLFIQIVAEISAAAPALPCKSRRAPPREGIRRDGRVA